MARKVTQTPILPRPTAAETGSLQRFDTDLVKALYRVIGEQARAINELVDQVNDHEARITDLEP